MSPLQPFFGRRFIHANFNHATHARPGELLDGISMGSLSRLSKMGVTLSHHVRTNLAKFVDLITSDNLQRLKGMKTCFLS